jgi:hypothetical protein
MLYAEIKSKRNSILFLRIRFIVNYEASASRVTVTLPSGLMATMEMEADYPQSYANVIVRKLDEPTHGAKQLESWKAELNRAGTSTLAQVVERLTQLI